MEQKVLGSRYKIIGKIAEGGMATLYTAEDTVLSRIVAIKVLKEEYAQDDEFLQKFKNEALAVAKLNHPNIISIFDVGQEDHTPYIVMEYVEGENLKEIIRKHGKFSQNDALKIGRQIAASLEEAHKKKIIHRDIKSANIMLTGRNMVKVGDFGIAKVVSSATITAVGSIMGSVHYFSPEQARGGFVDQRTDLYSLGIVLYEITTGRLPYTGDSPVNVALQHIQSEMKFLGSDGVGEGLQKLIFKLTQKNPDDRYHTAEEVVQDITHLLNDDMEHFQVVLPLQDLSTKKMKPSVPMQNHSGRASGLRSGKNRQESKRIPVKKKKSNGGMILAVFFLVLILSGAGALWASGFFNTLFGQVNTETFVMIDLRGKSVEDAKKELDKLNKAIVLKVESVEENALYAEGTITKQDPRANTKVVVGAEVKVTISGKSNRVQVPKLKGMSPEDAEEYIKQKGLVPERKEIISPDPLYVGKVFDQYPDPDKEVEAGEKVTLIIGKSGDGEIKKVPATVGLLEEDARKQLLDAGFQATVSHREDKTKREGEVLEQNPAGGMDQIAGTKVIIVVNDYKEISIPSAPPENTTKPANTVIQKTKNIDLSNYSGNVTIDIKDVSTGESVYLNEVNSGNYPSKIVPVLVDGVSGTTKKFDVYINGTKVTSFDIRY